MYSIERKAEIISMLELNSSVDVNKMAAYFKNSKETIRRDLRELEAEGVVKRTHGGAVLAENVKNLKEYPLMVRGIQQFDEKNAICEKAAGLILNGDTIFVDNSSTCLNLLKYIDNTIHVTIVTNSLQLLMESAKLNNPNLLFICLGGVFNNSNFSIYGNIALENAKAFYPNKVFVSCAGLSKEKKITDNSVYEAETKRFMVEQSKETVLLADHTKFTNNGSVYFIGINQVSTIVTDNKTKIEEKSFIHKYHVEILVADV